MKVRPGYQKTEVGVIPENWGVSLLKDCCRKITDGTHDTPKPVRSGVPFLTAIHVKDNWIDFESCLYLTEADHMVIYSRCNPQKNDVLMVNIGAGVATTALVDVDYEFSLKNVALLKPDTRTVGAYLNYSLAQRKPKITQDLSSGGAQPFLSLTQIGDIKIPLPPTKAEQESIAEALSDADALIESLEQLLAKKRQLKQGAMQELLTGKKRLPGFSGKWEVKRLQDTAILKARIGWQGLTTAEYLDSGNYYLVTGTEFKDGYIDWNNCHYVTESRYKQDKYIQLKEHDVLLTKDGTIGKVALITNLPKPATLNSGVFVIRPVEDAFHPEFFYYLLCSNLFVEFLTQLSAGSTINHLYQKDFVSFVYRTPPTNDEQSAIAAILSDMDAEIAALEAKLAKALQLKQGMMQELLTGRIRLV